MAANLTLADLPAIAFSKNVLIATITATGFRAAAPAAAVGFYEFTGVVADAVTIPVSWTDGGVVMTATSGTPDNSGNQFPSGDGSAGYVTSLIPFFQANFLIDSIFDVSADTGGASPRLIFTARAPGAGNTFPAGLHSGSVTDGADDTTLPNFCIHTEVWITDAAGVFGQVFSSNIPLDYPITGDMTIDIHEILHASLLSDVPLLGETMQQQCVNSVRQYFLKFGQFFGDIPTVQAVYRSDIYVVAKGGLGMQPSLLRDIYTELFIASEGPQTRFMRQGTKNKLVTKEQPEWLTWINLTGEVQTAAIEVTINNSDSSTTVFSPAGTADINPGEKYQYQAGYAQLNIPGRQAGALIPVYYTVRLRNEGGYLTDSYNFIVDYEYREFPGYFVYENSYGAFQTLATVGKGQLAYDRTKDDAQLSLNRRQAASIGDFIEANIYLAGKGAVSVGYDRSATRDTQLQRDFLLSRTIYLYQDGVLLPIGLNTKSLSDAKDGATVYANAIEYYYKYQEDVWTEIPQADADLAGLIGEAGSAIPADLIPALNGAGTLIVLFGDPYFDAGTLTYALPFYLADKSGYVIYSSGLGGYLNPLSDVSYNAGAGSFTILVPGFTFSAGDELIIWPSLLIPPTP